MSEFLAEARILVRPDTTAFRGLLEAELKAATKTPITVPVVPVMAGGIGAITAQTTAFTTAQAGAAAETQVVAAAMEAETIAATKTTAATERAAASAVKLTAIQKAQALEAKELAAAQAAQARSFAQGARGAAASGLSLLGLRGATLAASGAFLAGTAAVVGFSKAIQSAATLETELNVFRVTAGATADEMDRVAASAKQLGRDITLPGVTAGSAATAMTELAKAGLDVEDAIAGARGALQLATAAQIDVKQSTELVANALNAFGLEGEDAVKIADLLAGAAKSAQGEIGEFGTALGQVASVADQFGVSAGDTVTLLTQLAKAGLQGGRAGTTLRVAILGLIKPTAAAKVELEKLQKAGVEITKPNGAFDPTAFAQINEALKRYSKEQQNVVRNTIFSSDAIKVLGRATSGGVEDFNKINQSVNEAGVSLELSAARTQGLAGDVENLSNQVSGLGLTIGNAVKGPLSGLVVAFAEIAGAANTALQGIGDLRKELDKKFEFKIPGTEETGNSVGDKIVKNLFLTSPAFIKLTKKTLDDTILGIINDARDTVASEKAIANLATQGGVFGVTDITTANSVSKITDAVDSMNAALDAARANLKRLLSPQQAKGFLNVEQIENIIGGFDAQEVRAKIAGDNAKLLDVLNTETAFFERQLNRDFVKRRPALQRAIENALLGATTEIGSIRDKAAAETDRLKREAQRISEERAKAIKDAAKAAADRIAKAAEEARQAQRRQQEALRQSLQFDISFSQINNNESGEIKAREALIKQLKKEKALTTEGTVKWKELRNAIAEQRAAIDALNEEKKKQVESVKAGQAFAQASFEFLQTQQGFASSLLGNLIPSGATAGLVGGGSVQSALTPAAGAADGQARSGPTSGQANSTNHKLDIVIQELKQLNGEQAAPEANRQYWLQKATMDY